MRLLTEPTLHFFAIGLALFAIHAEVTDPRTVVITPQLKADLSRRFSDQYWRPPSPAELDAVLAAWKRDEVLYREALHERLEQQDSMVRSLLAEKLKKRIRLELPKREPTERELDAWLASHKALYETVEGSLPSRAEIRPRLVADWAYAAEQQAFERAMQALSERYRFEEAE